MLLLLQLLRLLLRCHLDLGFCCCRCGSCPRCGCTRQRLAAAAVAAAQAAGLLGAARFAAWL
jgi:hypothetical protein